VHFPDQLFSELDLRLAGLAFNANEEFPKINDGITVCLCGRGDDRIPLCFRVSCFCGSCTYLT
jgi:hypothetical protein